MGNQSPITRFQAVIYSVFLTVFLLVLTVCDSEPNGSRRDAADEVGAKQVACDPDNGGLNLPEGFCAPVVADNLGFVRHLTVNDNGDIYLALRHHRLNLGGIMALRDTIGDGKVDLIERFGEVPGIAINVRRGYLYFGTDNAVLRYDLQDGALVPTEPPELIVGGFPEQSIHSAKSFAFGNAGWMYVDIGAPSNACQQKDRGSGSPGLDPCPLLARQGGIWRFRADQIGQTQEKDGYRYASGIRYAVAIAWNPVSQSLYVVQHGRDELNQLWPGFYTVQQGAELPSEEFLLVEKDSVFSWPYCYYDQIKRQRVLAPEYGGDGRAVGRCSQYPDPIIAFPGHYGPNDLMFYTGDQFPEHYRDGAFIAFHGSYNRAPLEQAGYQVVFVPFDGALPVGEWELFADGFAGGKRIDNPEDAEYRPTGLAQGPDGSMYISDSVQGRIWRVLYRGQ
ncbi:MAG: sorbosone dehydrogenase [Gammaproteobacteria bacterium]|nr:sorbosone dehydrogenase [Gammaproteobacteria bacterium]MCI0591167.1 sorbosone dehydrogenase [Gammaproteobacteria bacterium]